MAQTQVVVFNGHKHKITNAEDFGEVFEELCETTDSLIEQVELIKTDLNLTARFAETLAQRNSIPDGSQMGLSTALAMAMRGRAQENNQPAFKDLPALPAPGGNVVAAAAPVQPYNAASSYPVGTVVTFNGGLYQWQGVTTSAPGTAPSGSTFWVLLADQESAIWTYADITSPALPAIAAPGAGILGNGSVAGAALPAIVPTTQPGSSSLNTHLDVEVVSIQNTPGMTQPTDHVVRVVPFASWSSTAGSWTITPYWLQQSFAVNTAIAIQAAGIYRATVRYRQRA